MLTLVLPSNVQRSESLIIVKTCKLQTDKNLFNRAAKERIETKVKVNWRFEVKR